jgi:hypothetical protein
VLLRDGKRLDGHNGLEVLKLSSRGCQILFEAAGVEVKVGIKSGSVPVQHSAAWVSKKGPEK